MEGNLIWDIIKTVIVAGLAVAITTLGPLIMALRREREEKGKIQAETAGIGAEAAQKIVAAAGSLQDSYTEILREYRQEIDLLLVKLVELQKLNKDLQAQASAQSKQILDLTAGVKLLQQQVESLGGTPAFKPPFE